MLYNYPSIMKNNIFFISTDLSVLFTPDKVKTPYTDHKHKTWGQKEQGQ